MALSITGRPLVTATPGALSWRLGADGPRERAVGVLVVSAAAFLGLRPERRDTGPVDLLVGGEGPGPRLLVLPASPPPGADGEDWAFLALKTPHARPLPDALAAAREERARLLGFARALAGESSAPSPRALAGYLHRFRDALAKDLDSAAALTCLWDGLRPGALSPGSRAAFLREAFSALGLSL